MADTGLILISSLIQEAISKATPFAAGQVSFGPCPPKEFENLAHLLTAIQPVAEGAEECQESDRALRLWLQKLKDAVYDAVDLLDECDYHVLQMEVETPGLKRKRDQVHTSFSPSNLDAFSLQVDRKLSEINESLAEIRKEVDFINLMIEFRKQKLASDGPNHEIVPILDSSEVVGREDDVSKMVDLLDELRSKHPISGIAIVGVAGVGKTTVAKLVYMKAEEEKRYDVVAWVCVSGEFHDHRILGELLEYFNISGVRPNTIHELLQDLGKELENKKFLLILDDAQEKDASKWNDFLFQLSEVVKANGSSIVLTTRSEGVASVVEKLPMYRYDMQRLSDDQCWMIIKKLVLSLPSNAIGYSIAKQCGGLPLLATAIGETMNSIEEDEWLAITRSREWKLENRNSILSVLKQSFFDCVPSSLKKCFSYCSIFPKGFEIRKDDLIQLWMAGGFLQQSNESSMTMEDIGNKYLNEFVSNSLFQSVRRDACVESYKMLDLVHDLALSVSEGETSIWKTESNIINSNVRNLRIEHDSDVLSALPQRLHSLFLDGDVFIGMQSDLKSLRSFKLVESQTIRWPISLDKSKHLRYLEIAQSKIGALPGFSSKFHMLQTLKVTQCKCLIMLPDNINKLDSLRHLYLDKPNLMPKGIGHLTSLQTLPIFFVRRGKGFTIEELGCLTQLRGKMEIRDLDLITSKSEAIRARLNEKTELHELVLKWNRLMRSKQHEEVLEGLQSHSNLKSLSIIDYNGCSYPSWIDGLSSLQQLKIESCGELISIPEDFRKLRSLSVLDITYCSKLRSIPEGWLASLTCLKELRMGPFWPELLEFPELAEIHHLHASLEALTLNGWAKLESLPHRLQHLTTLKKLHINGCGEKASLKWFGELSVKELRIGPLDVGLTEFPELTFIHHFPSLERLELCGWYGLGSLPHQLRHLTALKELVIRDFDSVYALPEWLGNLSSLRELNISNCVNLFLPSVEAMRRLSNLQSLIIEGPRVPWSEWKKISHIPNIRIDGWTVQSQQHYISILFRNRKGYV
ncbi:hypothetical protein SLEP1_g54394 [Rubroshorea leprosula]|uniref:Uncharacterized protein n=1 Tax=Rubroshorea leprosula TaxID=152421 RepID=A0AAV5MCQ3_9ROSI|nr:hypothetical protein SLEP1_g54394 [Rubroshorea leprosula]